MTFNSSTWKYLKIDRLWMFSTWSCEIYLPRENNTWGLIQWLCISASCQSTKGEALWEYIEKMDQEEKVKKCTRCAFWPLNACHCSAMFLHLLHKHGISKLTELNLVDVLYGGNFFKQVSITSRSIEKWINPFSLKR